ncbi:MAG: hypothetical protein KatS3mg051_1572 [Anaerolineae bacterium]|nr:MAG: hypothetical protein KatS3mg051_1572 [Anaerolineae bacterium]
MATVTQKQIIEALLDECGVVRAAARRLGVSHETIYKKLRRSERLQTVLREARSRAVDVAEEVLWNRLQDGDWEVARYVLDRLGGDRGWTQRVDIHHQQQGRWRLEVVFVRPSGRLDAAGSDESRVRTDDENNG